MTSRRIRDEPHQQQQRENPLQNNNNNNNNSSEGVDELTSSLQQQELALAFRQAAVRCLNRFEQNRVTTFDRLLALFALYFADVKHVPFVKLIYDSQYREEYEDLETFLAKVLMTNNSSGSNSSKNDNNNNNNSEDAAQQFAERRRAAQQLQQQQQISSEEMKQTLEELNIIVEAVTLDQIATRAKIQEEKEMRRQMMMTTRSNNDNSNTSDLIEKKDTNRQEEGANDDEDDENEDYFDDANIDDLSTTTTSDDDNDSSFDGEDINSSNLRLQRIRLNQQRKVLKKHERLLRLANYFKICRDFLENGQSVAISIAENVLHTAIADEAATLVSRAGSQLPRAIVTLEALSLSDAPGIDTSFYQIVTKIAKFSLARQEVAAYVDRYKRSEDDPPPPPPPLPPTRAASSSSSDAAMLAMTDAERIAQLNKKQTRQESEALMERSGETLAADELAFVDEVVLNNQGMLVASSSSSSSTGAPVDPNDPLNLFGGGTQQQQEQQQKQGGSSSSSSSATPSSAELTNTNVLEGRLGAKKQFQTFQTSASLVVAQSKHDPNVLIKLVKPERFAKLILGYTNTRFNRTHYTAENPPPKSVMAYEFTLFYPGKSDPSRPPTFKLFPTEKGWDDDFCFIEFYGGPPYAKVAYRIVNRKWDTSKSGATFDPSGRYRLHFKFVTTGYRR